MEETKLSLSGKQLASAEIRTAGVQAQPGNRIEPNNKETKLTKIQGMLTSGLRFKPKDQTYMAFFRPEYLCKNQKHSWEECERTKCKDCEIPVIFRIDGCSICIKSFLKENIDNDTEHSWKKPNLNKGNKVILEGTWANSKQSKRPSFTCYSYQIIED